MPRPLPRRARPRPEPTPAYSDLMRDAAEATRALPTTITTRTCPDCGAIVPTGGYGAHRREAHGIGTEAWERKVEVWIATHPTPPPPVPARDACPVCQHEPCDNPIACARRQRTMEQAARMKKVG